jgi:hypothetical protein
MENQSVKEWIQEEQAEISFKLTIYKQGDILYVKAEGERSFKTLMKITEQIMEACPQNDTCRALVDVRAMGSKLNIWETFRLVTSCFARVRNWHVLRKAAIVDREDVRPMYKFLETVADNRGYNLRVFEDTAEAIRWLAP